MTSPPKCQCDVETYCSSCLEEMARLADHRAKQDSLATAEAKADEAFWHELNRAYHTVGDSTDDHDLPRLDCGCDPVREFCDLCAMPDPRNHDTDNT